MTFVNLIPPPYINVKQYGAKGDGITDDTTAIQAAIDSTTGNQVVFFPYGEYIISSSIIINRSEVALIAEGEEFTTQITIAGTADPSWALIIGNTANVLNCTVRGLTFKGRNNTTSTGGGIKLSGSQCSIKQSRVIQFGGTGIKITPIASSILDDYLDDVYLTQNGMNTTTHGDNLVITTNVTDSEYHRVISAGDASFTTTRHGFNNSGSTQKFVDCHAYFCAGDGFHQTTGNVTQIIGGEWETNAGNNIYFDSGSSNFCIIGATIYGSAASKDIAVLSSDYGAIIGCACESVTSDKNIGFYGCSRIQISDSTIKGATLAGIEIDSGCQRIDIHDNNIEMDLLLAGTYCFVHDNVMTTSNITEQTGANNNKIHDNLIYTAGKTITKVGASTLISRNAGFKTENHGSASITSAATTVTVTHGLALTPTLDQIMITPQTTWGSAAKYWISGATSTQFTINVNAAPGATLTFSWTANVGF
jgi:hypothetical protein